MSSDSMKKRQVRRHDHIAKDLRTPKYKPRVVRDVSKEDDRTYRRYRVLDDFLGYDPYYEGDDD